MTHLHRWARRNHRSALWLFVGLSLLGGCAVMDGLMGGSAGSGDSPDAQTHGPGDTGGKPDTRPGDPADATGADGEDGLDISPGHNNPGTCEQACPIGPGCVENDECIYPRKFSAGYDHLCAVFDDGSIWCRGKNDKRQLGNGSRNPSLIRFVRARIDAQAMPNDRLIDVAAGKSFSCGLTEQGKVFCWGTNEKGQLGQGDLLDKAAPVQVSAQDDFGGSKPVQIMAGKEHACVLTEADYVYCWGDNSVTQLGAWGQAVVNQYSTTPLGPVEIYTESGGTAGSANIVQGKAIVSRTNHTCTFSPGKAQWHCWGANHDGQFGKTTLTGFATKMEWPRSGVLQDLATGVAHTCVVNLANSGDSTGMVYCWGYGIHGRLGYQSNGNANPGKSEAVLVKGTSVELRAKALALGDEFSCALTGGPGDAQVYCWGNGVLEASAVQELNDLGEVLQINAQPNAICALIQLKDGSHGQRRGTVIRCEPRVSR